MTTNDSRRIAPDQAATPEEVTDAISGLTRVELKKLEKSAKYRIRGLGRLAMGRDWQDLLNETILAFYRPDGRKWKKNEVDILRTLTEAMRSVAWNWKQSFDEQEAHLEAELITTSEDGRESYSISDYAGGYRNPEADFLAREQLAQVEELLAKRELAGMIFLGMKEEMNGPEIREWLGISEKEFETEMTWIRRKVRAAFKETK
jgi:hypothetical protein